MKLAAALVLSALLTLGGSAAPSNAIDLDKIINEPSTSRWTAITYTTEHGPILYVFGDMEVIEQPPRYSSADDILPTCKGTITPATFKRLLQVMKEQRFVELPDRSEFFRLEDPPKTRRLHSIIIDDGKTRFIRGFDFEKAQRVPPQFEAIEQQLETIRTTAVWQRPCRMAPAVKRRQHASSVTTPESR